MFNSIYKTLLHRHSAITASPTCKVHFLQSFSLKCSSGNSTPHSLTVSYLINSCGFSPASALSACKHVSFETPEKPDSVLAFLKAHGFSDSQVSLIIGRFPNLLMSKPEKTLLPKLQFFDSVGISIPETAEILARQPRILKRSVENHMIPAYSFLKSFLQSDEKTIACIKSYPCFLSHDMEDHVKHSMNVLRGVGVSESHILYFLSYQPRMFRHSKRITETVEVVKKMGFNPLTSKFLEAVMAMLSMSKSTWARKVDIYREWGWSEEDVLAAFRNRPRCMTLSEDQIKSVLDFFVNKLGWESSLLAKNPTLLLFRLDKRLIPRASVMQILFEKGLAMKSFRAGAPYMYTEQAFLKRFVHPYQKEAPQLMEIYMENWLMGFKS